MRKAITTSAVVLMMLCITSCEIFEINGYTSGWVYSNRMGYGGQCYCGVSMRMQDGSTAKVSVACPCDIQPGDSCKFVFGSTQKKDSL